MTHLLQLADNPFQNFYSHLLLLVVSVQPQELILDGEHPESDDGHHKHARKEHEVQNGHPRKALPLLGTTAHGRVGGIGGGALGTGVDNTLPVLSPRARHAQDLLFGLPQLDIVLWRRFGTVVWRLRRRVLLFGSSRTVTLVFGALFAFGGRTRFHGALLLIG
ncbi:hypothetical protein CEXT_135951 [Caerostris extrusa]|uniref:Secreted protein n=1 Tax=Caerostris extrusa TaxID=172846 RepID=A0AAV4PKV0_CAEEX|nr:hypothetical protein CEXT_135951 [Caerostris extrusa]